MKKIHLLAIISHFIVLFSLLVFQATSALGSDQLEVVYKSGGVFMGDAPAQPGAEN